MSTGQEIVFESEEHFELYCQLFPEHKTSARLASTLLLSQSLVRPEPQEKRTQLLAELLSDEEKEDAEKYLSTLEQLRLSLIVSHEQVDFCFSLLYPTPLNNRLQQLLHLYLDSTLKWDLAQCYWDAIGGIKEKKIEASNPNRLFVKAKSSTFLFAEWAEAHTHIQEHSSRPIEFWELPGENLLDMSETCPTLIGSAAHILSELSSRVAKEQNSSTTQLISFGGAPHALLYLESRLEHLKVPFKSLFSPTTKKDSTPRVLIYPFQSIPHFNRFHYWSYIDDSFFAAKEKLFLTETQLFTLLNGGFSIPRITTDRLYLKNMLNHAQEIQSKFFITDQVPSHDFAKLHSLNLAPERKVIIPNLKIPPKKLRLSATQLESFTVCPTQYLVRHRLKLRPILPLEDRYSLIFGSAVHAALEAHFQSKGKTLEELFRESLASNSDELTEGSPLYTMMLEQFQQVATHFVTLEQQLKKQFNFSKNIGLEKSFEMEIEHFSFNGKIDRIIEREDSSQLLIDYKTGTVDFSPNHIEAGDHYQALLYLLSLRAKGGEAIAGVIFYDLKKGELRRGLLNETYCSKELKQALTRGHVLKSEDFESLLLTGKEHLLRVLTTIESGEFFPTPSPLACERCEAATFCRQGVNYV
jgi:RecB family exonuclease